MPVENTEVMEEAEKHRHCRAEFALFLFLAVFLFPLIAVVGIGGYGLLIWLSQLSA